jgi:hypothetical protein
MIFQGLENGGRRNDRAFSADVQGHRPRLQNIQDFVNNLYRQPARQTARDFPR